MNEINQPPPQDPHRRIMQRLNRGSFDSKGPLGPLRCFKFRLTDVGQSPAIYQCGDLIICETGRYLTDRRLEFIREHLKRIRIVVALSGLAGFTMPLFGILPTLPSPPSLYQIIGAGIFLGASIILAISYLEERFNKLLKSFLGKKSVFVFYEDRILHLKNGFGLSWLPRPKPMKVDAGCQASVSYSGTPTTHEPRGFWKHLLDGHRFSDPGTEYHKHMHTVTVRAGLDTRQMVVYGGDEVEDITLALRACERLRATLRSESLRGVASAPSAYVG